MSTPTEISQPKKKDLKKILKNRELKKGESKKVSKKKDSKKKVSKKKDSKKKSKNLVASLRGIAKEKLNGTQSSGPDLNSDIKIQSAAAPTIKYNPKNQPAKNQNKDSDSDSDSSDSDLDSNMKKQSAATAKHNPKNQPAKNQNKDSDSDSDSSDSDLDSNMKKQSAATTKHNPKNQPAKNQNKDGDPNSDSSDLDSGDIFLYEKQKKRGLESNRISFRKTLAYNENQSAAWNFKNKASDAFVPTVNTNFFISDSESETDSGDDYDSDSFPVWHKSFGYKKESDVDWPKKRKFGYSDNLKLEKRVKKICRRENISFSRIQEIFCDEKPSKHRKLFQKIARPFPNVTIRAIAGHCKEAYHPNKNNTVWTEEDVKKLNELVKFYGRNIKNISKDMNRTASDIKSFMSKHLKVDKKKVVLGRWKKEEDEMLAKGASELISKNGKFQGSALERLFNGTKTRSQIESRYKRIKHLIQPDGTLVKERKPTVLEELEFLENLKKQAVNENLIEESQLNLSGHSGFV
ncbi:unnamed protein product [Rhizopus stolonifer]